MKDLDLSKASISDVHRRLSDVAADIANQDPRKDRRFSFSGASYQSEHTEKGVEGLCIEWDPAQQHLRYPHAERERVRKLMDEIGRDAMVKAIADNGEVFFGLIIGEAREGRNYFERFND